MRAALVAGVLALTACGSDGAGDAPVDDASTTDAASDTRVGPESGLESGSDSGDAARPPSDTGGTDASADAPSLPPLTLSVASPRGSGSPAITHGSYDYAPTVMRDGVYKMWWCGGVAGDHVLYAEASALAGPWHAHGSTKASSYDDVFQPTGKAGDFDGAHTCDPSVVRVGGTYIMFYGGLGLDGTPGNTTRIGVATSPDGRSFTRLNGGKPIIDTLRDPGHTKNDYGAGQPSAVWLEGKFYLVYTDTMGRDSNPGNGAGQYVLRSSDPTFQKDVEELTATGFVASPDPSKRTTHSLFESFSVDWMYVDAVDAFFVGSHTAPGVTRIHTFRRADFGPLIATVPEIPGDWHEGPGLVTRPDKHALPGDACDHIPVDLMRAVGGDDVGSWDLGTKGADLVMNRTCAELPLPKMYEGMLISTPTTPLTMVIDGKRLQFAKAEPALILSHDHVVVSDAVFNAVPYGASMGAGAKVLGAAGRPAAFQLDGDKLWPTDCLDVITANGSAISSTDVATWDALGQGSTLRCLR